VDAKGSLGRVEKGEPTGANQASRIELKARTAAGAFNCGWDNVGTRHIPFWSQVVEGEFEPSPGG
jgi:hypothetical protein